ncbi:hypothetical protein C8R42DRAFT_647389 [Lentinula raphanica]|nr:hypothetical protein C8R42DRAFT_647389 [Lentinula raphanica]
MTTPGAISGAPSELSQTFPYPCIRIFEFTRSKLGRLPAYPRLLKLGKERKDACYPRRLVLLFWQRCSKGHTRWVPTLATDLRRGDILHPGFLMPVVPFTKETLPTTSIPSLSTLHGHVSAIFTGAFFHLFNEEQQELIVRTLAGLLSPEPVPLVLGVQGGISSSKGISGTTGHNYQMFCYSPESWKELCYGRGYSGRGALRWRLE